MGNSQTKPEAFSAKNYYSLLGVPQTASTAEIKRAYKEKALKHHPDKNMSNQEEASRMFASLQEAYAVLSDERKRNRYDLTLEVKHKQQTSRKQQDTTDHIERELHSYLKKEPFSGFSDTPDGFYSVYGALFTRLANIEKGIQKCREDFPMFGDASTAYSAVNRFYTFWALFETQRTFAEYGEWDVSSGRNRYERREMEKENTKTAQEKKREYEETILKILTKIKTRDPRIQKHRKQKQEKKNPSPAPAQPTEQKTPEYYNHPEIEKLERELESLATEEKKDLLFECLFCEKTFKSQGQLDTHRRSNRHKEKLKVLGVAEEIEAEKEAAPKQKRPEPRKKEPPAPGQTQKEPQEPETKKEKKKRRREKQKEEKNLFECNVCCEKFQTRNKLFDHIKKTNHALHIGKGFK
ncbi:MAG: DnaJ-class molecular chaperone with C-terminal Zn finger domain [Amphiamblys sp. WSBS2006]|nr:MAG: DnaJ-class molecular chaperone with C-terminal Zn finger domain [Amphiamblys sp. WSBS2006]